MRVFIYYNLHKHCWSIKCMEGRRYGLVVGHTAGLILKDATFKVSEAGRQRVLRERKKNVHAGVVGRLLAVSDEALARSLGVSTLRGGQDISDTTPVTYNPYRYPLFHVPGTADAVESAGIVHMLGRSVRALDVSVRPMAIAATGDLFAA